ncbi:MAG: beta-phosphoglucomutase [Bacteroidota bacterium]|jgi:beta-phosphoglucomutase|nr:MAG: beta-phosphoglucomutase [Bacteroidota bacterium]
MEACIFDLDGVIVDTARYHYLAWKRLAAELGFELTPEDNERLKGVSRIQSLNIVLEIGGIDADANERERLAEKKNTWFNELIAKMEPGEIFPGVKALVSGLRSSGRKVALASSSKNAQLVVDRLQIRDLFDVIVDGSMIEHTKPDPEIFLLTAERLDVPPPNCLVFEDAEAGVEAALAAGMKCVGIGSPTRLGKAHLVLPSVGAFTAEMLSQLEKTDQSK